MESRYIPTEQALTSPCRPIVSLASMPCAYSYYRVNA